MDLWERHQVRMVIQGDMRFDFSKGALITPMLEPDIIDWARKHKEDKFVFSDLLPRRVGVTGIFGEVVQCSAVSWAQIQLMTRSSIRANLPRAEIFKALAVSCLVVSVDGKLIVTLRSGIVSSWRNMYHVSAAGYIDRGLVPAVNPLHEVLREIEEELGLKVENIKDIQTLGLCEALESESANYDVLYVATSDLTGAEVLEQAKGASDSWEGKLRAITEIEAREMLNTEKFDPSGAGTLLSYLGL